MSKLPTVDQFRKQFKDALRAGLPMEKCLDLGTVWTGKGKTFPIRDAFRSSLKDAMKQGLSLDKSIQFALDAIPEEGIVSGEGWDTKEDKTTYRVIADKKAFRNSIKDALKEGKNMSDAINCGCGKH